MCELEVSLLRRLTNDVRILTTQSYPVGAQIFLSPTTLTIIVPQSSRTYHILNFCRQRYRHQELRADSLVSTVLHLHCTRCSRRMRSLSCAGTSRDMLAERRPSSNIPPKTLSHNFHRLSTSSPPRGRLSRQSTHASLRRARRQRRLHNPR